MSKVVEVGQCTIITGDNLETLRLMPDCSVQCCVTSPPYWGLRDYGTAKWEGGGADCDHLAPKAGGTGPLSAIQVRVKRVEFESGGQYRNVCKKCGATRIDAQLGLESTPDEYVAQMVAVFREVKRVLRDDGTLWLNLGDSYSSFRDSKCVPNTLDGNQRSMPTAGAVNRGAAAFVGTGIKHKDLVGTPWRVAFALQADGWYLRQDIIWSKPNPMPESCTDRCTKAHEYLFLLAKSAHYYYDHEAIKEPMVTGDMRRPYAPGQIDTRGNGHDRGGGQQRKGYTKPYTGKATKDFVGGGAQDASATKARIVDRILSGEITGRNKRSVWTVTTKPFKGAHFATFPPDLIEPCVLAGSKIGDVLLDPFAGAGTVGLVANRHGRSSILLELSAEYCGLAAERLRKDLEHGRPG